MVLLVLIAIVAGFVDTLAGGGGLLIIPALLLAQVPPVHAIATNKLQGSFGTLTSATTMVSRGLVNTGEIRLPFVMALIGSVIGAVVIQYVPAELVKVVTPLVLVTIALYFMFSGKPGESGTPERLNKTTYHTTVVPTIGFYDGAFGPGAGSFYTLGGVALGRKSLIKATAHAKVLNFASNIAALLVFILAGKVLWLVGGVMVLGTMLGAYLGSLAVIHRGSQLIRPAIVTMSLLMLALYLWKNYFSP